MYIPEGTLFIILAGLVGFAFSGLLNALGLFIWILGGMLALLYVGGPYAVFGVIIAASLVVRAAPYCSRWLKTRRDARLEAIARADAAKKAAERDAYRAETLEKLRQLGFTWVDGWGPPPSGSLQRQRPAAAASPGSSQCRPAIKSAPSSPDRPGRTPAAY